MMPLGKKSWFGNMVQFMITWVLVVVLLFTLAGCGGSRQNREGADKKEITVTDFAGRTVSVKVPVERVVLAESRDLHEFAAIEGDDVLKKIVGWGPELRETDKDTYDKFIEKYPETKNIPEIGSITKDFNIEKIVSLNPDLVTIPLWDYESATNYIEKLEQAGIPVVVTDFWAKPLENPPKSVELTGKLLNKEERAREIADFYNEQLDIVYSRLAKINKPKPKVYIECGWKGVSEYGNSYSNVGWGEVVSKAGGDNIAKNDQAQMPTITPEFLLDADPDIIIITGANWPATPSSMRLGYYADETASKALLQGYLKRPGWDSLKAVQEQGVYSVFHGYCFRIYNFAALQAFAKWFYPEEFKDIDPEAGIMEFHKRFMPRIDYSGVWMLGLK